MKATYYQHQLYRFFLTLLFICFSTVSFAQTNGYEETIHQDTGTNSSNFGPLDGFPVYVAQYFPSSYLSQYQGMLLYQIRIYIAQTPVNLEVNVYGEGSVSSPGPVLFSQEIPVEGIYKEWVVINLDIPITIGEEDLWIGYRVENEYATGCIGTDAGPANPGFGDWYSEDGQNWYSFNTENSWFNRNWNIAGQLKAPVTDQKDVAVKSIIQPISGANLGNEEDIVIEIKNYGFETQTSIPYTLTWSDQQYDGIYEGTLESEQTAEFTVPVTADLSEYGTYTFEACTNLPGDERTDLDCVTKTVENQVPELCIDGLYALGCSMDRINSWSFSNIEIPQIDCPEDGSAYLNLQNEIHEFESGQTYTLTVTSEYINHYFDIWIDYDDNLDFTTDELILDDGFCEVADTEYTFEITIQENLPNGTHVMRMRSNYDEPVMDPCEIYSYGMAIDFTAEITDPLAINNIEKSSLTVFPVPAKNKLSINSEMNIMQIQLINLSGKIIYQKSNLNNCCPSIDIKNYQPGIYMLRLKDENDATQVEKVIIQ